MGDLTMFDAVHGRIVRTIALPTSSRVVAVDASNGRVVVGGDAPGGARSTPSPWVWLPPWVRQRLPFLSNTSTMRQRWLTKRGRAVNVVPPASSPVPTGRVNVLDVKR